MNAQTPEEVLAAARRAYQAGEYLAAAQGFAAAAAACQAQGDLLTAAELRNNQSVALLQAGDPQGALQAVEGTPEQFAAAADRRRQALALGNRAAALEALGRLEAAAADYRQAADLLADLDEPELRAATLNALGAVYLKLHRPADAALAAQAALENQPHPSLKQRLLRRLTRLAFRLPGGG